LIGLSQRVYDAAIMMEERLERLLPEFTLNLFDKLERHRFRREEENELEARKRSRVEQVESSVAQFEAEVQYVLFSFYISYCSVTSYIHMYKPTIKQLIWI